MKTCGHSEAARAFQRRQEKRAKTLTTRFAVREKDGSFGIQLSRKALKRFAPSIFHKSGAGRKH